MTNSAGPLVLETLFKHFIGPRPAADKGKAREDLMYDEAFVLMKTFLEIATKYPVAALQRFGQVRTPSPPWVGVHRVTIPRFSLNDAADYMIKGFGGEEMAYKIAGGTKWWQVRAGQGVEGEWIVMKKDWKEVVAEERREQKQRAEQGVNEEEEGEFRPEMDRLRCMLYIHGGAYYWGSINTHRYTIWRYARKMHGRCFAVNYRKTPQYPFPCAIQDCLAAYLYLTNPPPEAKHRPVDPKSIILAGDSAGGGLCLALLQILRDTEGLELPAGAVLISPWSDLTHSFPSILQNTATDIVPPYGFIHKPSSLWPPPPPMLTEEVQRRLRSRVKEVVSKLHHHPHKAEEAHQVLTEAEKRPVDDIPTIGKQTSVPENLKTSDPSGGLEKSKEQSESDLHPLADKSENKHPEPQTEPTSNPSRANPAGLFPTLVEKRENEMRPCTLAQCDTPLKLTVKNEEILIDTQIQLYATNAQLCHPWVSPVLGYLGGLPPLFIMCGDKEVLRDEIIFLAHKAANPDAYPIRDDVKELLPSLKGIEEKHSATNVHLQVYDGACHDLPLLSMTRPSRGAFRAIASFARYVTPSAPGSRYISRSYPATPKDSSSGTSGGSTHKGNIDALSGIQTPQKPSKHSSDGTSTPVTSSQKIIENVLTTTPAIMSPKESLSSPFSKHPKKSPVLDLNLGDELSLSKTETLAQLPLSKRYSKDALDVINSQTPNRNVSFASSFNSSTASFERRSERRESILPPSPNPNNGSGSGSRTGINIDGGKRENSQPSGDDSGPRFEEGKTFLNDWNAKEGEAGWAGIYKGDDPFLNHMIRERVSTTGIIRPLESSEELQAMQMPLDEVGYIKEGPAMRYINGQALWDKKYHRASKNVKKRREKNLKIAHKESGKMSAELFKKAHEDKLKGEESIKNLAHAHQDQQEDEDEEGDTVLGTAESWNWALNGESPPPSAIISRRDFAEARQLALMADRLDSSHNTSLHGLSIWVGLVSFFSSSMERNKASEVIKVAREAKKIQQQSNRESTQGDIWTDLDDEPNTPDNQDRVEREDSSAIGRHDDILQKIRSKEKKGKKKGVVAGWFGSWRAKREKQKAGSE
uniref:Alpha/beta hydrolase fold-3 domain-containing protein n=1 Tax=Kwoniella bestiolae CBS 10118 TaxID=1296100 RepID=A0A1B9G3C7_9TREE|nr:hypothetical protein I302_05336 [Kwoniella bestiolae CBS 10118]OCF25516.1 hypothetical protein I302_05336 [Kwoniella bestiolae CBS 10118]